jgi:glycosyltransferase involved in cell wall biosynthesis
MWCQRHDRRFVFSVASDPECDVALPLMQQRERLLYRYGLRRADAIITQTRRQQRMLHEGFGLEATVLPMPCPGIPDSRPSHARDEPARVVWVGRFSPEKRLGMLVEIASALPQIRFDVIGPPRRDVEQSPELAPLASLPNVALRGRVARDQMSEAYRGATALLCTSTYEGFPNTFLEAWGHGVPVVSTVDPDDLLGEHGLGLTAPDATGLAAHLRRFAESASVWRGYADRGRDYCVANHAVDRALPRFEALVLAALQIEKAGA